MVLFFLKQNIPFLPQWKLKKKKKNQTTSTVLDGHVFQNIHVLNKTGKKKEKKEKKSDPKDNNDSKNH